MRKIIFSFFIIICISQIVYSQSGWFWQNPLPQGNDLLCIKFVNQNTGFVGGRNGVILKTTNLGNYWRILKYTFSYQCPSLYFVDENLGFAACRKIIPSYPDIYSSIILKTVDGGENWADKTTSELSGSYIYQIEFVNQNTGYIVTSNGTNGFVYKSIDGGENWSQLTNVSGQFLYQSCFINDLTGFVCGAGRILKTTDGGNNWINQLSSNQVTVSGIHFINPLIGYAMGYIFGYPFVNPLIFKTINGGANWTSQTGVFTGVPVYITFIDNNTGFACQNSSQLILKTTNAGLNWIQFTPQSGFNIYSLYFDNSISGIAVGSKGIILRTTSGGESWIDMFPCLRTNSNFYVEFANYNTGYACNSNNFYRTTNRGLEWIVSSFPFGQQMKDLEVIDSATIYGIGNPGVMLKSTDAGGSWVILNTGTTSSLKSLSFVNINTGYALFDFDYVIKTVNGGNTFSNKYIGLGTGYLYQLCFVNENTGYVGGYYYSCKTTDGGNSWTTLPTGVSFGTSVFFSNSETGYIATYGPKIYRTTNGGMSWILQFNGQGIHSNYRFGVFHFLNINTGYVLSDGGHILKTTNGGVNWYSLISPTDKGLTSVFVVDSLLGFIGGSEATLLRTTNGGNPISIRPFSNLVPNSFSLRQNYPNPFNPTTKIRFDLPSLKLREAGIPVRLIIYDLLGREVATLINERLKPGTYEVEWPAPSGDGSSYASGVYFYSLITSEFTETRKLILLK